MLRPDGDISPRPAGPCISSQGIEPVRTARGHPSGLGCKPTHAGLHQTGTAARSIPGHAPLRVRRGALGPALVRALHPCGSMPTASHWSHADWHTSEPSSGVRARVGLASMHLSQSLAERWTLSKGQFVHPCSDHFHAFPRVLPIRDPGPSSGCSLVPGNDRLLRQRDANPL